MNISRLTLKALGIVLSLFAFQTLAQADPQVYVASTGTDTGTCERSAPCRQISYALTQVTNNVWHGGTVVALDSGSYEPFKVKNSVSVVAAPGVHAEVLVRATIGIHIDATPKDRVVLRGLSLKGDNNISIGIKVDFVAEMYIENCIVSGFYRGIDAPVNNGQLLIRDTTVTQCIDVGIRINSESSGSLTVASIEDSRIVGNSLIPGAAGTYGLGIYARKNVKLTVRNTQVSHNSNHGLMAGFERGVNATIIIENCAVTHNLVHGVFAFDGSKIYVSNSTVAFNHGYGFAEGDAGTVYSRRNNTVEENGLGSGAHLVYSSR